MKISFYNDIKSVAPSSNKDLFKVLELIKSDKYKLQIAKIRIEKDKKKRNALKIKLNNATFCGTFKTRSNSNLISPSGLAMLDFDNVEEPTSLKETLSKNKYTLSAFISPSGNGVKVLVKIPLVDNNEDYQDYYLKLIEHYNQPNYLDTGTKDIARATFLSYDRDIYINPESDLFADKIVRKLNDSINVQVNIPISDEGEIIKRLMVWFNKRWSASNRNNNLHALARQFNSFGVSQKECERILIQYEQTGFKQKEILSLINSAYKYSAEFGTSSFEDNKEVSKIRTLVYSGESVDRIYKKFPKISKEKIKSEVKKQEKDVEENQFWYFKKNGQIGIAPFRYKSYLNNNKIYKYFPSDHEGFIFIKKEGNFIEEISVERIKDFVLADLKEKMAFEAWDMMASRPFYFSKDYMSMIDNAEINLARDTKDYAMIYYQNKAVKITKDKFTLLDYDDIKGFIWKDQIIPRNISLNSESNGEYKTFIWKIAGENIERYYTFKSVIGYLLHSFKNESKDKTIIFNDELISDVPNGGSGKGVFHKAISNMKNLSIIDGKLFDIKSQFLFQTVNPDSQIILFDDVKKGFNFSDLFSISTGELKIEKKGKDPIILPFEDSPKITITTNFTIKGEGGSHKRRIFEIEMSSYFNENYTPEDEFKKLFFVDWKKEEWENFDNYMLRAVQFYLKEGLVKSSTINLEKRKIIDNTNIDFISFVENVTFEGQRYYRTELKDLFANEYTDFKEHRWFSSNLFNRWIKMYCQYKGLKLVKGRSNGDRYIEIGEGKSIIDNKLPF